MNKLATLLIFSIWNFIAYGTPIDVSTLVTYEGEVKYYDLEHNSIVNRAPTEKTDLSQVSVLLEKSNIRREGSYFRILPLTLDKTLCPIVLEHRTRFIDTETFVNSFFSHVYFSIEDTKTLSAIRSVMYHIVDNPIGCTLISNIIDSIGDKQILFKVEGEEFMYLPYSERNPIETIVIPDIKFSENIAQRQDITSYGPQQDGTELKFSTHYRPFYIGLVHELIHLMHNLKNEMTGEAKQGSLLYSELWGGEEFWGTGDDLYTIWGVYSVDNGPGVGQRLTKYNLVSELTFRIYDQIPIRMFYEVVQYTSVGEQISLDVYEGYSFEDFDTNPLATIKKILKEVSLENFITISVKEA